MPLITRLRAEARRAFSDPSDEGVTKVLKLHRSEGLTWGNIASHYQVSQRAVFYLAKRLGLQSPAKDITREPANKIRRKGYNTPLDYFVAGLGRGQSMMQLSKEIGMSRTSAREWYEKLIKQSQREEPEQWQQKRQRKSAQ